MPPSPPPPPTPPSASPHTPSSSPLPSSPHTGSPQGSDAPPFRYSAALADELETRWQRTWDERQTFRAIGPGEPGFDSSRPKFYGLDMFPYPSGSGLHVGHPEGYTATDIICRHARMKGKNVLHPMGWDAFGLPAEQYAIATGVHPAITTRNATDTFRRQLKRFGFSYDWSREIATIDPQYYAWTQWIFLQLYDSWFDPNAESPEYPDGQRRRGAARPIRELIKTLDEDAAFQAASPDQKRRIIDQHRLAYIDQMTVNWCPALGTVLANDEVIDGKSERGGHPVVRKPMRQWQFRITSFAQRLVDDLALVNWPESTRIMQTEWIGRSEGAEIEFEVLDTGTPTLRVGASDSPTDHTRPSPLQLLIQRIESDPQAGLAVSGLVRCNPYPDGMYGLSQAVRVSQRHLPHYQMPGATYFVTWRCLDQTHLSASERQIVLDALVHFDNDRCRVYAACVMPDHVHWIVRPFDGQDLLKLRESVKRFSATQINAARGSQGRLWEPDGFDHILRGPESFAETLLYVVRNPVEEGLVARGSDYPYTFVHNDAAAASAHAELGSTQAAHAERGGTQNGGAQTPRLTVFTTRPDTLFGATYMVVAPEHPLVEAALHAPGPRSKPAEIRAYVQAARNRSDVERMESKEKTGVDLGIDAINPATGEPIPIWVAEYVLMGYGTGAIMAVPAHDDRDFDFAKAFALPVLEVVAAAAAHPPKRPGDCFSGEGIAINSAGPELTINALPTQQAKAAIITWLESTNRGRRRVNFKLRDWVFSRQRYWGEPFPIVYDAAGNHYPISSSALPVVLPELEDYAPVESADPQPLLAKATSWVNTTAGAAGVDPAILPPSTPVRRETNTMPGSAGSSWYFLRYCDPSNTRRHISREADAYWMGEGVAGVDLYIGGSEHAVGHLLYSRFWQKVLFDLGEVSTPEPFDRLFHQGMITSFAYQRADKSLVPVDQVDEPSEGVFIERATGAKLSPIVAKMSKSLKNVINPDEIISQFGADTFRLYEMYMGPLEASKPWNTKDTVGSFRFLQRVWRLAIDEQTGTLRVAAAPTSAIEKQLQRTIAKVDADIPKLAFNTAIAAMMEFVNLASAGGASGTLTKDQLERFTLVLAPFAPHIAEELWLKLGHSDSLAHAPFPSFDPKALVESEVEIPISINGKPKGRIIVPTGLDKAALEATAMASEVVQSLIAGKAVTKVVVVPGKMINLVIAG